MYITDLHFKSFLFCFDGQYEVPVNITFHLLNVHELVLMCDLTAQQSCEILQSKPMRNWLHIWSLICPETSDINLAPLVLKTNGVAAEMSNAQVFIVLHCSEL